MKSAITIVLIALSCAALARGEEKTKAPEEEPDVLLYGKVLQALQAGDTETVLKLTVDTEDPQLQHFRARILQNRGEQRFFDADIAGSVADFDEVIALVPERDPYHWQRGISYYYAGEFQKGKEQFERHQTVNSQDVENAVWHFLCAVRAPGGSVEAARKDLIPIQKDTRVPMKEVHLLFSGKGTPEQVIAAAKKEGDPEKSGEAKNAFLYAHLYLALYHEATGNEELMKKHIDLAANDFRLEHYMGKVAQVHAKLREVPLR